MGAIDRPGRTAPRSNRIALVLAGMLAVGFLTTLVAGRPGGDGRFDTAIELLGVALAAVGLVGLLGVGVSRVAGRARGPRRRRAAPRRAAPADPPPAPIPEPGWPGWRFRVGRATHEVWAADDPGDRRLLLDGRWFEPEWHVPWSGRLAEADFRVGRHRARLVVRFDRSADERERGSVTGAAGTTYELFVDGAARPDSERLTAGWLEAPHGSRSPAPEARQPAPKIRASS
jgi:hypothetical protein